MEVIEKVIGMIKEKFETTEPVTAENLETVVSKILARNDELEGELETIKLTSVREKAIGELTGLGYEEKAVKETIEACEDEKEIEKTVNTMKKFGTKVTEKTETKEETKVAEKVEEKTEEGERKTVIEVEKKKEETVVSDENKNFKKIFNEI
jgi:hypothetical protein